MIVVVDLDGTLTIVGERIKHLKQDPPDWSAFYSRCGEDRPNAAVLQLVHALLLLSNRYEIVFCTGRPEEYRKLTVGWLEQWAFTSDDYRLLMRADGDHRPDSTVKPELLANAGILKSDVEFILEDRSSMIEAWRKLGFACFQVAEGLY